MMPAIDAGFYEMVNIVNGMAQEATRSGTVLLRRMTDLELPQLEPGDFALVAWSHGVAAVEVVRTRTGVVDEPGEKPYHIPIVDAHFVDDPSIVLAWNAENLLAMRNVGDLPRPKIEPRHHDFPKPRIPKREFAAPTPKTRKRGWLPK